MKTRGTGGIFALAFVAVAILGVVAAPIAAQPVSPGPVDSTTKGSNVTAAATESSGLVGSVSIFVDDSIGTVINVVMGPGPAQQEPAPTPTDDGENVTDDNETATDTPDDNETATDTPDDNETATDTPDDNETATEPQPGDLSGTVTDGATGEAIANATVSIGDENVSAMTDANGSYDLDVIPGHHEVTATADGYEDLTHEVTVSANESTTQDFALTGVPPAPQSDSVDVTLTGAPDGLRTYSVTVSLAADANATIESVESQLPPAGRIQVIERTNGSITFRAADLSDSVGAFDDSRSLATVSLSDEVTADQLELAVNQLTDDSGDAINASSVELVLDDELFTEPLPGSAGDAPPTDPDGDGRFEDVDGDQDADFDDAIALAFVDYGSLSTDQQAALDFDGDESLTFADAIELAFQV